MTYDKTYTEVKHVFGTGPERTLVRFVNKIDKTKPVLDIGAGQGRNAVYLAAEGFSVDAIDPSSIAVKTISKISKGKKYNIAAYQASFDDFTPQQLPYSAIFIYGLIQILDWKSIDLLVNKVNEWTKKDSLIFVTSFSTKDATFKKYSKEWNKTGKNSFSDDEGDCRTFLMQNEIVTFFKNHRILYHWEGLGSKHRHGNSPVQEHAMIELVAQKN